MTNAFGGDKAPTRLSLVICKGSLDKWDSGTTEFTSKTLFFQSIIVSGQFITTSAEVTLNGGLVREYPPKMALN